MADPVKVVVRRYIADRVKDHKPLPSQEEIRRALGWPLVQAKRKQ
jgi:hypothetical protein